MDEKFFYEPETDVQDWEFDPRRFVKMVIAAFVLAIAFIVLFVWTITSCARTML